MSPIGLLGDSFVIFLRKNVKNDVAFLMNDERVLMFRSSFFDGQILGESSAFVCAKKMFADFRRKNDVAVFGTILSSFWYDVDIVLGRFRHHFGIIICEKGSHL